MAARLMCLALALGVLGCAGCGQAPQRVFAVQVAAAPPAAGTGSLAVAPAAAKAPTEPRLKSTSLVLGARNRVWDLNAVTAAELMQLPAMDATTAAKMVAGQPYKAKRELLKRHILTAAQYARWKDYLVVHRARKGATGARP